MPEQRLQKCRQAYESVRTVMGLSDTCGDRTFDWVQSGWCSQCGYFTGRGEHVCPDGTKPIALNPKIEDQDLWGV